MRRLVFVTYSFPSGVGERWKYDDVCAFANFFDEVVILPFINLKKANQFDFPSNVRIANSVFREGESRPRAVTKFLECLKLGPTWIFELIGKLIQGRISSAKLLLGTAFNAKRTVDALRSNGLLEEEGNETTVLFFWGVGGAEATPFIKGYVTNIIVCFHNFDLYKERAVDGYFPFRNRVVQDADILAPCSRDGADYLRSEFRADCRKILIKRLGVEDFGIGIGSVDGVFRVISCSFVHSVKRVDLICAALAKCQSRVEWVHIGDGPLFDEIKRLADKKLVRKPNITYQFSGYAEPDQVRRMLVSRPFDLFISLSAYEGVPVSIMEALSAGIPVIATDVGGVSEIVDASVGRLLPSHISATGVAAVIDEFSAMSPEDRIALRNAARLRADRLTRAPLINVEFAKAVTEAVGGPNGCPSAPAL